MDKAKAVGRVFVVAQEEELVWLTKAAARQGVVVVPIQYPEDIARTKVGRVDILYNVKIDKRLENYCKLRKIQIFSWTKTQWSRFIEEVQATEAAEIK